MKYYAILRHWNRTVSVIEIKKEWIDDIVSAVQGQYTFVDNKSGFGVRGQDIMDVTIKVFNKTEGL